MSRLFRPHIPLEIRCQVAERQMLKATGCVPTNEYGVRYCDLPVGTKYRMKDRLNIALFHVALALGCEISDLRLDHDPPLGARTHGPAEWMGGPCQYFPDANDPDYLFYRPHGVQFEGSHDVKTRIRGDHGQFSDIALIKRQRRRERGPKPKRGPPIKSRGFGKQSRPFAKRRKK